MLKKNRSAPNSGVIPVLYYPEVRKAVEWLTTALPLIERLRIGDHRCQLVRENGAIVIATPGARAEAAPSTLQSPAAHSVMLRVTERRRTLRASQGSRRPRFSLNQRITWMANVKPHSLTHGDVCGRFRRPFSIPPQPTGPVVNSYAFRLLCVWFSTRRHEAQLRSLPWPHPNRCRYVLRFTMEIINRKKKGRHEIGSFICGAYCRRR